MHCCKTSLLSHLVANPEVVKLQVVPEPSPEYIVSELDGAIVIEHNLNKYPVPTVFNSNGRYVEVAYRYEGKNKIVIEPNPPISGKVYLS